MVNPQRLEPRAGHEMLDILIVEDSAPFATALEIFIGGIPRARLVGVARSAEDALPAIAAQRPALVLMDINLPGMDGIEATRRIKAQPGAPRVLIVTSHDTREFRTSAGDAGADGYVLKGNAVAELGILIEQMVRKDQREKRASPDAAARPPAEAGRAAAARGAVLDLGTDVMEHLRRISRARTLAAECTRVLMHAESEARLLQEMCASAVAVGGYRMAWIGLCENDAEKTIRPVAWAGAEDGYFSEVPISWGDNPHGQGPAGVAVRSGLPGVVHDLAEDLRSGAAWARPALARGYASLATLPLRHAGETIGVFGIANSLPNAFERQEMALLSELAGDLAYGIAALRDRAARDDAEERFLTTFEYSPLGIAHLGPDLRVLMANRRLCEMLGYSREELQAGTIRERSHPDDLDTTNHYQAKLSDGTIDSFTIEKRYLHKSGAVVWATVDACVVRDAAGAQKYQVAIFTDITARRRAERLRMLEHAVNRSLAGAEDAAAALQAVLGFICESEGWEVGQYWRADEGVGLLRAGEVWMARDARPAVRKFIEGSRPAAFAPGQGLCGSVWQRGEPLWVADAGTDARVIRRELVEETGIRGAFLFPVIAEGRTTGVLEFWSPQLREPDARLLAAARVIGSQIGQFLQRKQAEEELRRFRVALDNSGDMIVLIDRAGMRFVDVNHTACRLLGYSKEELLALGPQDVLPESRQALERDYDALIASPAAETGSIRTGMHSFYRRKDGTTFPFESTRHVLRAGDGHLIAAVSRDISERVVSERTLHESEERFRSAFNQAAVGMVQVGLDGRILQVNQRLAEIFGYSVAELQGRKSLRLIHPDDLADSRAYLTRMIEGNQSSESRERRGLRKDGSMVWLRIMTSLIRDQAGKPQGFHAVFEDISESKAAQERLLHLAHYDALTELPNRVLFRDRLEQALAQARRNDWTLAVMFLDVDRFKVVNDTLGHALGDRLLQQISARLKSAVRVGDTVGRLGGDEFGVILSDLRSGQDAAIVAEKLTAALAGAIEVDGHEIFVNASTGITLYPGDSEDAETLIKNADTAMYRAKDAGRNTHRFYAPEMNERALERLQLESDLRRALEREEFVLFYQPKLDLASGRICGAEALVRWNHPQRGLVPPGTFIPLLEETGLIQPVGEWILRRACRQISQWCDAGMTPLPVAVNLSARQFQQRDIAATIKNAVERGGIDPALLEIEITESSAMNSPVEAIEVLNELQAAGIRVAVDDFGTGYSSLGYLKRLPIDALKIDRSFIENVTSDADDASITQAVIALAHNLGLKVVAEGVETAEQLAFLRDIGCDQMQGYYFSRPVPAEEFERMASAGRRLARPAPVAVNEPEAVPLH